MDKRDLLFLAAGVAVVVALSFVLNPPEPATPAEENPVQPPATLPTLLPSSTPMSPELPRPEATPYRISYAREPHQYAVYLLPKDIGSYGGSDPPWTYTNTTTFAVMEGSRGGITERFPVLYSLWRLNCSVYSERAPQYARFQLALMDAETGSLVDALEIRHPGSSTRIILQHSREFYLIIGASDIDRFNITLEVPEAWSSPTIP